MITEIKFAIINLLIHLWEERSTCFDCNWQMKLTSNASRAACRTRACSIEKQTIASSGFSLVWRRKNQLLAGYLFLCCNSFLHNSFFVLLNCFYKLMIVSVVMNIVPKFSIEFNSRWLSTWFKFTSNLKWQVNGYECVCAPGFSGLQCDIPSQVCGPNVCQNGATCVVQPPDFVCECPSGYGGKFCEMKIDHCVSSPCHNYATCKSLAEGYQCSCRPGYEGVQCERDTDECAGDPCQNNGTCVDGDNRYTCTCKAGFTGLQCETSINECLSEPCHNGGRCVDKENGFECICKPTYSGETCTKSKTTCTSVQFQFIYLPLRNTWQKQKKINK